MRVISIFVSILAIAASGCYYDKEEELYPTLDCATDNVTYMDTVLPILSRNCFVCHSTAANFGGITLEGYNSLLTHVNSGRLLGAIKHQPGFSPMPQNQPQLVACDIEKMERWVADGAPNN